MACCVGLFDFMRVETCNHVVEALADWLGYLQAPAVIALMRTLLLLFALYAAAASADWQGKNPYGYNEGCNWILESKSPNIDFVCIHSYADQWRRGDTTQQWLE
jgi:hypothetical protein